MNPKVDRTTPQRIHEQAALWIIRQEEGALSRAARRRFEAWLELPGRAEALRRMQVLCQQLEQPWRKRRLAMRMAAYDELLLKRRIDLHLQLKQFTA